MLSSVAPFPDSFLSSFIPRSHNVISHIFHPFLTLLSLYCDNKNSCKYSFSYKNKSNKSPFLFKIVYKYFFFFSTGHNFFLFILPVHFLYTNSISITLFPIVHASHPFNKQYALYIEPHQSLQISRYIQLKNGLFLFIKSFFGHRNSCVIISTSHLTLC